MARISNHVTEQNENLNRQYDNGSSKTPSVAGKMFGAFKPVVGGGEKIYPKRRRAIGGGQTGAAARRRAACLFHQALPKKSEKR